MAIITGYVSRSAVSTGNQAVNSAAVIESDNVTGIDPNSLAVVLDCTIGIAQPAPRQAAVQIDDGKLMVLKFPGCDQFRAGGDRGLVLRLETLFPVVSDGRVGYSEE